MRSEPKSAHAAAVAVGRHDEIEALRLDGAVDQLEIARLKKRKLLLKDEISNLSDRIVPDIIA